MADCGDVTSLESMQIQYKHQIFEIECITGLAGGVAGGANIDYATNPVTGQVQKTLPAIFRDTGFRPASFTFATGGTLAVGDSDVVVLWPISGGGDGQYYLWKGAYPKAIPAASSPETTGGVSAAGWLPCGDITLRSDLAAAGGALRVGYNSETVDSALDRHESDIAQNSADISSTTARVSAIELESGIVFARNNQVAAAFVNGRKGVVITGDSISAGAFAGDLYSNGWTRLLARSVNGELGAASYGFTPMLTLGSGKPYQSIDIHSVAFVNAGTGWAGRDGANGSEYPNGFSFRSTSVGNKITFTLPSFMRRALVHYANQSGGGTFTISVNGAITATVATASGIDGFATAEVATPDNQYGAVSVVIETTTASPVDICGISYLAGALEPCVQNFSTSGRRAHNLGPTAITTICANAAVVIFALGHNDFSETSSTYIAETTQVIDNMIAAANTNGTKVVVPDFCWTAAPSNWMRIQLKRLAEETRGVYVDFPSMFVKNDGSPADSSWLINTLNLFVDGSHPNDKGNEFIFEVIAKSMKLSCTSKTQALTLHDYWLSLPLQSETSVENSILTIPSAVKRTPSGVAIRLFIEAAPGGAFPAGTYALTTKYPAKSGISTIQGQLTPVMKVDGTALVGGITTGVSGEVILKVFAGGATFNDIYLSYQAS